jgi:hypothetical protein
MKSKRDEVPTIILCKAQVEKMYFTFNLEYKYVALSRGMLHRLSSNSHAQQKPNYPSKMSETQSDVSIFTG